MKKTDKNLQNKQSGDDTLLYLLLFFLIVALVGLSIYLWQVWNKQQPPTKAEINYKELGEKVESPDAKEVSKLWGGNLDRARTIKRGLNDPEKNLSDSQRAEIRRRLTTIQGWLNEFLKNNDLRELTPEQLATVYSQLYKQGKRLVELRSELPSKRTVEELKKQKEEIQPKWDISPVEQQEIKTEMNKWIKKWYNQFIEEELTESEKQQKGNWWYLKPIDPPDINYFRREWVFRDEETNEITSSYDLRKPVRINFEGYGEFITTEDIKSSTESGTTFGLTLSDNPNICQTVITNKGVKKIVTYEIIPENCRNIVIKLKKEFFFNREQDEKNRYYEEWITKFQQEDKQTSWSYDDICWDALIETISHELAHAVINTLQVTYDGERVGGHGNLFDRFHERIEKMMRNSPDFIQFENWWKKKK